VNPEITSAVTLAIAGLVVGVITYLTNKLTAHKGAQKVKDVVEQQFEERIGQPNGLGSVVSMMEILVREGRDRTELLIERGMELSQQLNAHTALDEAHFSKLENLVKANHPDVVQAEHDAADVAAAVVAANHPESEQ
jgi:hypothetical protein